VNAFADCVLCDATTPNRHARVDNQLAGSSNPVHLAAPVAMTDLVGLLEVFSAVRLPSMMAILPWSNALHKPLSHAEPRGCLSAGVDSSFPVSQDSCLQRIFPCFFGGFLSLLVSSIFQRVISFCACHEAG